MTQTEFVTKIDSRGSVNIPKALQEAGYVTGIKVRVILKRINAQLNQKSDIQNKIMDLFYQGFFEEFLEELSEREPILFKEYTELEKVKPREKGEVES